MKSFPLDAKCYSGRIRVYTFQVKQQIYYVGWRYVIYLFVRVLFHKRYQNAKKGVHGDQFNLHTNRIPRFFFPRFPFFYPRRCICLFRHASETILTDTYFRYVQTEYIVWEMGMF